MVAREFISMIAHMTQDEECTEHGPGCDGMTNDCIEFDMTGDDAMQMLNDLIGVARIIKSRDIDVTELSEDTKASIRRARELPKCVCGHYHDGDVCDDCDCGIYRRATV